MIETLADRGPDSAGFALFDEPADGEGVRLTKMEKRVGRPADLVESSGLAAMSGSHAIAHTRMATESRVSVAHAHPFRPAPELALVHNGSLSNHNGLRRELARLGGAFETDNDSEVAARFLAWRLERGDDLEAALAAALGTLDGFFTFIVADADGIVVVRDRFACKPALVGETEDWVAVASERAAISALPGGEAAEVWEPEPARIYSFGRIGVAA
jgi:amidophosphoribosyltransferase